MKLKTRYTNAFIALAVIVVLSVIANSASASYWVVRIGDYVSQNNSSFEEVLPGEDMDSTHTITWAGDVYFEPSGQTSPQPDDDSCWLSENSWWEGTFNNPYTTVRIQIRDCNFGQFDVYVDGNLEFSYNFNYPEHAYHASITGVWLTYEPHTIRLKAEQLDDPEYGEGLIDYVASPAVADVDIYQETYRNTTGQTAYGLVKRIEGNVPIVDAIHDAFEGHLVVHDPTDEWTVLHFGYGGSVPNGETTKACFITDRPRAVNVYSAVWWGPGMEGYIGEAGPPVSSNVNNERDGSTRAELSNDWHACDCQGDPLDPNECRGEPHGPITITEANFAVIDEPLRMEALDRELLDQHNIPWQALDGPTILNHGETGSYNLGQLTPGDVVLLSFTVSGDGQTSEQMLQFKVPRAAIPALYQWGLIIMAVLLVTAGVVVILRKRRATA